MAFIFTNPMYKTWKKSLKYQTKQISGKLLTGFTYLSSGVMKNFGESWEGRYGSILKYILKTKQTITGLELLSSRHQYSCMNSGLICAKKDTIQLEMS